MSTHGGGSRLAAAADWERRWAPYDAPTYALVLQALRPDDVVLEIGAGDLRLARQMAARVRRVVAVEINPALLPPPPYAGNLQVVCADARQLAVPAGVTTAVLLMRHCRHVALYWQKLAAAGCRRLITNARWGFGVECIDLQAPLRPFTAVSLGWYACRCGAAGFVPGPPEQLTPAIEARVHQVVSCPACQPSTHSSGDLENRPTT
ncbi:MAG: methyltransferase domain-containing protein [Anaerolineales bacterium]|nr:methyltransferase domain-containing protein [Anaerolineales bacterium]